MIPNEDRGIVAPPRVGRGAPPAERGLIHHIVMDQGGGVEKLDHAAKACAPRGEGAPELGAEQEEDRPEAFSPRGRDVVSQFGDEGYGGGEGAINFRLAGRQRRPDEATDLFSEKLLEGREGPVHGGRGHSSRTTTRSFGCTWKPGRTSRTSATEYRSLSSTTRATPISSSRSPRYSPLTGWVSRIRSRLRLRRDPRLSPSWAVRSTTTRCLSTRTT